MLWRYLVATFKNISINLEEFKKHIKPVIYVKTIFSDKIDYNKFTHLNLCNNSIGKEDAQYLAKSLEFNSSLTYLNLYYNSIRKEGTQYLSKLLEYNSGLKI